MMRGLKVEDLYLVVPMLRDLPDDEGTEELRSGRYPRSSR